ETHPFVGEAIDIRCAVAHHPAAITTQIPDTDVIAKDDENVWLLRVHHVSSPLFRDRGAARSSSAVPAQLRPAGPRAARTAPDTRFAFSWQTRCGRVGGRHEAPLPSRDIGAQRR